MEILKIVGLCLSSFSLGMSFEYLIYLLVYQPYKTHKKRKPKKDRQTTEEERNA